MVDSLPEPARPAVIIRDDNDELLLLDRGVVAADDGDELDDLTLLSIFLYNIYFILEFESRDTE